MISLGFGVVLGMGREGEGEMEAGKGPKGTETLACIGALLLGSFL